MEYKPFSLSENFVDGYKRKRAPFGFNGLGELVYMRTYSRIKDDGKNEMWWETVRRVVEGTYSMQKNHIERYDLGWNAWQAQRSAQEMYERIFNMIFLHTISSLYNTSNRFPPHLVFSIFFKARICSHIDKFTETIKSKWCSFSSILFYKII